MKLRKKICRQKNGNNCLFLKEKEPVISYYGFCKFHLQKLEHSSQYGHCLRCDKCLSKEPAILIMQFDNEK